jgi:hypothetical protein
VRVTARKKSCDEQTFSRLFRAEELEATWKSPKNRPSQPGRGRRRPGLRRSDSKSQVFSPNQELISMAETNAWVSSNRISTRSSGCGYCRPRLLARPGTDWFFMKLGDDVWSIRVHDSAENVTERLSCGTYSQRSRLGTIATHSRFPQHAMISRLGLISRLTRL